MKNTITILFFLCNHAVLAQSHEIWSDTLPETVNIEGFRLEKKIVRAEYGKVVMYFNQMDYLHTFSTEDTLVLTPKYFEDHKISFLLKQGKVKIFKKEERKYITEFTHHLKQYGGMCDRIFEFSDGLVFCSSMEIYGLLPSWNAFHFDTLFSKEQFSNIKSDQKKEFAWKEEFADLNDKRSIKIKNYFILKPGQFYVYSNNNGYGELDTTVTKKTFLGEEEVFYFAEHKGHTEIVSIGSQSFGAGIYFYQNDSVYTIDVYFEEDIEKYRIENAVAFLPADMIPGDSIIYATGSHNEIISYLKKEAIEINGMQYNDCIKLKIIDNWPETEYIQYVWLQKDLGMVKWMRSTGRIDELINQF